MHTYMREEENTGRYRNGALPAQNPTARSNWSISGQALIRTKSWDSDRHDWVFQVNWLDGNGDILFHFNPRPNEGKIVMNSRKYKDKKKTNNKNGFYEQTYVTNNRCQSENVPPGIGARSGLFRL